MAPRKEIYILDKGGQMVFYFNASEEENEEIVEFIKKTDGAIESAREHVIRVGQFQPHPEGAAGGIDYPVYDRDLGLVFAILWRLRADVGKLSGRYGAEHGSRQDDLYT